MMLEVRAERSVLMDGDLVSVELLVHYKDHAFNPWWLSGPRRMWSSWHPRPLPPGSLSPLHVRST